MYRDPDLTPPVPVYVLDPKTRALWLRALKRPEADTRVKAADAFALASRLKASGLEGIPAELMTALEEKDQHPTVRVALAKALVALEDKASADKLWQHARAGGIDQRAVVEPALARWGSSAARDAWLERLADKDAPIGTLSLAIRGVEALREAKAVEPLRERVLSARTTGPVRLEAARALGLIRAEGLEDDAKKLAADPSPRGIPARLAASALLRRHTTPAAVEILQSLAKDAEPAVATPALARLVEIDPKHAASARDAALASRDAGLRAVAVDVLLKHVTDDSLKLLTATLDDPHPDVRARAREALLHRAAKNGQRNEVIALAEPAMDAKGVRAREQAIILIADLEHKPAAKRLTELLTERQPEVFVTAAWALRRLGEPSSLPAVLAYLEAEQPRYAASKLGHNRPPIMGEMVDHQLSQLMQLLVLQSYRPALPLMRRMVPPNKSVSFHEHRTAGIWGLGKLQELESAAAFAKALVERLNDGSSIPPENLRVRTMSGVTLGRIKDQESIESLKLYTPTEFRLGEDPIANACTWALANIAGKPVITTALPTPVRVPFLISNE